MYSGVSPLQRRVLQLKQFSQQLQNVHPNVLAKALHKSIIFKNQDIIAINKPYGVPLHGMISNVDDGYTVVQTLSVIEMSSVIAVNQST